jgi:hypothetical protein
MVDMRGRLAGAIKRGPMNHSKSPHGLVGFVGMSVLAIAIPACAISSSDANANANEKEVTDESRQAWSWTTPPPVYTFEPTNPPPPPPGWPHTILTATSVDCAKNPAANEVIVATDENFGGACAALTPGFYPHSANLVVGNDAITSMKVGSAVRARVFTGYAYGAYWTIIPANTVSAWISPNNSISSMRVEPADRSALCDDLREGEIALFEDSHFTGDCVVLPGDGSYASATAMGIENDSISSIRNNSSRRLVAFWHPGFDTAGFEVQPHSSASSLPSGSWNTNGINDDISSIHMAP